ncbi:MAG TPA: hypothetical protein VHG53_01235 [Candidatus Limnocylindria bacterium]|nr:hypothetical protein [Candidatus Limnocylindria bacterium]
MKRAFLRLSAGAIVFSIAAAACGPASTSGATTPSPSATRNTVTVIASPSAAAATSVTKAADLRVVLNLLLLDHVYITAQATDQALIGNDAGFKAAAATLDKNTVGLGSAIGAAYGDAAKTTFLELWRKHIGFFVAYTQAAAKGDAAGKAKADADLDGYRKDFDAFITGANPNLPKGAVADLLVNHVKGLEALIDAQAAKDPTWPDKAMVAADHSQKIADPLSGAIAKQFPDKFPGDSASKAADLRVALNLLLDAHVQLTSYATGAALGFNNAGFDQAAATLDKNTVGLGTAIGSVYGDSAKTTFLELWRKHIGFFVNMTKSTAAKDQAGIDKAKADLDGYRKDFDAFITGANPNLPKGAVADLLVSHVTGISAFIADEAAKDTKAFDDIEIASNHSQKISDPLAEAIVKQMPAKFPGN